MMYEFTTRQRIHTMRNHNEIYVHMKTCENSFPLKSYASYEFMMILPAGLGMNTMIYSSHAAAPEVMIMISSEVE